MRMGRPTWSEHEAWLAGFLESLTDDELPAPLAICFTAERADLLLNCRRERYDDEVDPLTELAVVIAELAPDAAVVATPVRMRDLADPDTPVVARAWVLSSIRWREDGGGHDLRVRMLPSNGVGRASDVDVEMGPLSSVLDDAVRHRVGVPPEQALYAADRWGHTLYTASIDEADLLAPSPTSVAGGAGRLRDADAALHRLRRHARDLARRHLPTAPWPQTLRRPAVHGSTPDGWQPACPI